MGGLKHKIKIEKIERKPVISVTFTKRREGLFRKASQLCRLSPTTQIAILTTPPSTNSHATFYSFGHSSVDNVVSSLLNGHERSPLMLTNVENKSGLGFWWEDEGFDRLENVDELKEATDAVASLLNNVRLRLDAVRSNQRDGGLVTQPGEDVQLGSTETNNSEETTNQISKSEGTSGSGNMFQIEDDDMNFDDFFLDYKVSPLF